MSRIIKLLNYKNFKITALFVSGGFVLTIISEIIRLIRTSRFMVTPAGLLACTISLYYILNGLLVSPFYRPDVEFNASEFVRWDFRELLPLILLAISTASRYTFNSTVFKDLIIKTGGVIALLGIALYSLKKLLNIDVNLGIVEFDPSGYYFFKAWLEAHNAAGGLYVIPTMLSFYDLIFRKKSLVWFLLCLAGLMLTGSRTAAISFIITALILLLTAFPKRPQRVFTVSLVLVLAIAASSSTVFARLAGLFSGSADYNTLSRFGLWQQAWQGFLLSPLFGIGWGNYGFYVPNLAATGWSTHAHNSFLQVLAELGLVGAFLYLCLFGIIFFKLYATKSFDVMFVLIAVLISSVFEHNLGAPTISVPLFYLIGINLNLRGERGKSIS